MKKWYLKLEKLLESFYEVIKKHGEHEEIYVNPTSSEIDKVSKRLIPKEYDNLIDSKEQGYYIRYTAVPSKKLYVFSPYILHNELVRTFGIEVETGEFIHGIARKINGRWTSVEAHSIDHMVREHKKDEIRKFMNTDWSWMDKYILTTPFIKTYEPKFRRILGEAG